MLQRRAGYSRFYAESSVLYILRPRILVASLASQYNQASLRLAKGSIAFTNGIFDSREPPIWVPVTARPQDSQPAIRTTPTFFYAPGFSSLRSLHDITKPASGWQRVGLHSPMAYLTLGSPQSGSPSLLAPRILQHRGGRNSNSTTGPPPKCKHCRSGRNDKSTKCLDPKTTDLGSITRTVCATGVYKM